MARRILVVVVALLAGVALVAVLIGTSGPAPRSRVQGPEPGSRGTAGGTTAPAVAAGHGTPAHPVGDHVVVGMAATADGGGYWLVASDGGIFAFGDAPYLGSMGGKPLNAPIVGMAGSGPSAGVSGYWLVASDGGIFAFGTAGFQGSMGDRPLNEPIVAIAPSPEGRGYWLVASDGGIFAFGDASFLGSMGGKSLNAPIVAMAGFRPSAGGSGYWLVASDGRIFAFGTARFQGSTGGRPLAHPVVSMAADPASGGYRLVAADGGIFAFGDAPFEGSMGGGVLNRAVVGMGATPSGRGYWLVGADGAVYALGDAPYEGSVGVLPLAGLTVAVDPGHDGGNGGDPAAINRPIDGGGFTESCDTAGATTADGYTEHGFNFDVAIRLEALLRAEGATVVSTRTTDTGVGPCVDVRAAIGNGSGAAVAVSVHADGGPVGGRGYTVIMPAPVVSPISDNRSIVAPSALLGTDVRDSFGSDTGEPTSSYDGQDGLITRDDLGGLNLSTVPKVLIECANMANSTDAGLIETPQWRQGAARGIADGIRSFLTAGLKV